MKVSVLVSIVIVSSIKAQDDGQYYPDDEGRYIPDHSGRYIPDNSGSYRDDGTGRFTSDGKEHYENSKGEYKNQNQFNIRGNVGSATSIKTSFVRPNSISTPVPTYRKFDDGRWKIIRLTSDGDTDGFHWEYETENKIVGEENAKIHNRGTEEEIIRTQGFYKYTGPDNTTYNVEYTADENGFIPKGNHLPQKFQRAIIKNLNSKKS